MQEKLKREDCMSFDGFIAYIRLGIQQRVGNGCNVVVKEFTKNNGTTQQGLIVLEPESNISPTIYLDNYYQTYVMGESLGKIECEILELYRKSRRENKMDVSFFTEWENARQRIIFRMVNYNANKELLNGVPHRRILDLAVVYHCLVESTPEADATILIHNHHMESWKVTEDVLYHAALENTPCLQKACVVNMEQVCRGILEEKDSDLGIPKMMNIMTNANRTNGAGVILYQDVLKEFAEEMGHDLYIIPSSIHETILLPMLGDDWEALSQMVKEVNATQLAPEEVLSDHVYEYRRSKNVVSMRGESLCLSDLW